MGLASALAWVPKTREQAIQAQVQFGLYCDSARFEDRVIVRA
jgi:hypothetical protein